MKQIIKKKINKGTKMKKQAGFTLIELVIVVVILGFLAVTAIPKFIDLTEQAKQANIEGMAGGFATGISLARAQWESEGRPAANGVNRIDYDGIILFLTTQPSSNPTNIRPGYPTGLNADNADGTGMTATDCIEVWQSIFAQPPTLSASINDLNGNNLNGNNSNINYSYFVSVANNQCQYFLKETLGRDVNGSYEVPADTNVGNNFTYNNANSAVVVNINI